MARMATNKFMLRTCGGYYLDFPLVVEVESGIESTGSEGFHEPVNTLPMCY